MTGKKRVSEKQITKKSGWKVYEFSIVGGVNIVAKNEKDAILMAEEEASGAWDIVMASTEAEAIEDYWISDNSHSSVKNGGGEVDFDNWSNLSPQGRRAVQNLIDKLLTEES